jgi:hypothetical protein
MSNPDKAHRQYPTGILHSTYVEFFCIYWRGAGAGRNLTLEFLHKGGSQHSPGKTRP